MTMQWKKNVIEPGGSAVSGALRRGPAMALLILGSLTITVASVFATVHAEFLDPLEHPAEISEQPESKPLMSITFTGETMVVAGLRGVIAISEDGKSWLQSASPVQSDLVALSFPSASQGWCVGHDGVVLFSDNGGKSWIKKLDGQSAADLFNGLYVREEDRDEDNDTYGDYGGLADGTLDPSERLWRAAVDLARLNFRNGPTLPFLDVHFTDTENGILVGAFGLIAVTDDGGETWQPLLHKLDNPIGLSLNSVTHTGTRWLAAGERGHVFLEDPATGQFISVDTGYEGSFFQTMTTNGHVLVAGMRGTAYVSSDDGLSWSRITLPTEASINGAATTKDGRILLADDAGNILIGSADTDFRVLTTLRNERITGLLPDAEPGQMLVTTLNGIRRVDLQAL